MNIVLDYCHTALHIRMFYVLLALLVLSPFARTSSSFYDNPEQDPLPPTGPDSTEELHRKWDFEVLPC